MMTADGGYTQHELELVRKRRKPGRAVRFADIKVGDQLCRLWKQYNDRYVTWYYVVTDLWFDPVAGQSDPVAGEMVGVRLIYPHSSGHKQPHTRRGLASQGFHYAGVDIMAQMEAVKAARAEGKLVNISFGHAIRRRPKIGGRSL